MMTSFGLHHHVTLAGLGYHSLTIGPEQEAAAVAATVVHAHPDQKYSALS